MTSTSSCTVGANEWSGIHNPRPPALCAISVIQRQMNHTLPAQRLPASTIDLQALLATR